MGYVNREVILREKVEIYQRDAESPRWYAKLRIGRKITKRTSLGTTDRNDARSIAVELYHDLDFKHSKGISLSQNRFSKVVDDFLSDYKQRVDVRESVPAAKRSNLKKFSRNQLEKKSYIVRKYLTPYFETKNIQEITEQDIEAYVKNRLDYWTTGKGSGIKFITYTRNGRKVSRPKNTAENSPPSYNTINKELTCLRAIFDFASKNRLIATAEIPVIENRTKPDGYDEEHETPSFTKQEIDKLMGTIARKGLGQKNPKHKLAHQRLLYYIAIMAYSGMRTSEAKNLKISDCELIKKDNVEYLSIFVHSKGKQRTTIPLKGVKRFVEEIKNLHRVNANQFGWKYSDSIFLFSNEYGQPIKSFATALNGLLKECGLLTTNDGRKRSSRSFRPFYITCALLDGNMTIEQLAGNVGNSPAVIWKHYNRMQASNIPERFQRKSSLDGLTSLPEGWGEEDY